MPTSPGTVTKDASLSIALCLATNSAHDGFGMSISEAAVRTITKLRTATKAVPMSIQPVIKAANNPARAITPVDNVLAATPCQNGSALSQAAAYFHF